MNSIKRLVIVVGISTCLISLAGNAAPLPAHVAAARDEVIRIASENTLRDDNISQIRQTLDPHLDVLADWFEANRPDNEVELTQSPWRNLWYDDPDINISFNSEGGNISLQQDRASIYQVIQDGYYYNVSEITLTLFGLPISIQNFLKGAYTLKDGGPSDPRRNIVDLKFVANSIRFGRLPRNFPLDPLVYLVELGWLPTAPIPGPLGVTGELWNLYIDEELRISAGFDDSEPDVLDLYILQKAKRTDS